MAIEELGGQAQFTADFADFVLIECTKGLDQAVAFEEFLDAGHAVVVGLDYRCFRGAAGFDGVGVNGALAENPMAIEEMAGFDDAFLYEDELLADYVALFFGLADVVERVEELQFGYFDRDRIGAQA